MPDYTSLFTGKPVGTEKKTPESDRPREGYTLLLVDDEPNILSSLRRVFHRENYRIFTADGGEEALATLAKETVHVVISDYMMPRMNGAELLGRIRDRYPDTIRIMLTGNSDTSAVMGAVREGAVYRFLLKPCNDDDLRITVALALEQFDLIQKNRLLQTQNQKQSKSLQALNKVAASNRSQLPFMLQRHGLLTESQVQLLYKQQQGRRLPVLKLLLEKDWVPEKRIHALLQNETGIHVVSLPEFQIDPNATELIPASFCEKQLVLPLKVQANNQLLLAMADPSDYELLRDLQFITGLTILPVLVHCAEIESKIHAIYGGAEQTGRELHNLELPDATDPMDAIEVVIEEEEEVGSVEELLRSTEEPPAIRLVNAILLEAVRFGVSDIHIQPRLKSVAVRYRMDGILYDKFLIPTELHRALVSRIKIMAELDISERRRPQDGRITVKTPMKIVDMRISTLPTINGEKLVLRLLDRNATVHPITDLGLSESNLALVHRLIAKPQGIILATGPTGSGKTTTLYALLQHVATPQKNCVTIEDPVEFHMDLSSQVPVREKIGLDFPTVLRAIMRQDPDIILVGEIRDAETAHVAFQAAMTGHLVFSTLHAKSAVEAVARLLDMGLAPFFIATGLEGVIAQRLVRRICETCREPWEPEADLVASLGTTFSHGLTRCFRGRGCVKCGHLGYRGRAALHEIFVPGEETRGLIASGASIQEIRRVWIASGTPPMIADAASKVNAGLTTVEEILRVVGPETTG